MIIGTAGHIDHGKTSLVRRLTGVETDRLKEEKARGISIDLGFAYWPRPDGEVIGFVDVPGHEGLVHNMLAGATGIDFVMLVIAADDGVMPQTREHLAIMDLLGLNRGLVALNKCDLVDAARLEAVTQEIRAALAETGLADAEIIPVSAATGQGLDLLTLHLDAARESLEARAQSGLFRMAIDRCFTLPGLGTAVTGTVISGSIGVDDTVTISPRGLSARVRSINAHDRPAARGVAGQRCALVLTGSGVSKDTVRRGDLALDATLHAPTQRLDAKLRVLATEPRPIGQWFPVKVHHAAAEVPGRIVVLRDADLRPGEEAFVQLVLERPIAASMQDRFVVRDTSSSRTIGGGVFLDVHAPERKRRTPARQQVLAALASSDPVTCLARLLEIPGYVLDVEAFRRDRALAPSALMPALQEHAGVVLPVGKAQMALGAQTWADLSAAAGRALDKFHADKPDEPGIGLEQLRRAYTPMLPSPVFVVAMRELAARGDVALDRTWVRRPSHVARVSDEEERMLALFLARIDADPYRPPRVRDIAKAMDIDEAFVRRLMRLAARRGDVEEIAHDHFFTRPVVERMAAIAIDIAAAAPDGRFSAADFRDRLDNGRKVAIQILEFFDKHGFTIRRQDLRRINPARIEFFAPKGANTSNGGVPLPVGRPDFKSGWGRQTASGGFDSHPPPPSIRKGSP